MNKNDPNKDFLVRSVGSIFLGLIILALVYNVFFTPGPGMQGYMGGGHMGMNGMANAGYGFSIGSLLSGILFILIKLLSILLVIGLIMGIWVVLRDYLFSDGSNPVSALLGSFAKPSRNCPNCGSSVATRWDFCPDCGQGLPKAGDPKETTNQS